MRVKMIATDLDKTLLRGDSTVSDYTAGVFDRCRKKGIYIVFATARPERATKRFQKQIAADFIAADNGATIYRGDTVIRCLLIPAEDKNKLISAFILAKEATCITVETGGSVLTNYNGPPWEEGWNGIYDDFANGYSGETPKMSVECVDMGFLARTMAKFPGLRLYSNSGESWHQIMPREATKTNAIAYIAKSLGFGLDSVAAFGDDYNDIEMLDSCGIGVAVANAVDGAKAAADFVCGTNESDGVARWIEGNIL